VIGEIFWIWMLIDCIMNEPDKYLWIMILLFTNVPGAIAYFIIKQPVSLRVFAPKLFSRLARGGDIRQAESAAYNTPTGYNYSKFGDICLETGDFKGAGEAYKKALELTPDDIQSLWGAAQVDMKNNSYGDAEQKLEKVMKQDENFRFGEASLAYGKALFELNETKKAGAHLVKYLSKHSQPEAKIMMAQILSGEGAQDEAVRMLDEALMDIKGSPVFYYRTNRKWIGKIKGLKNKILQGTAGR
jgi:hypothetical protein